MAMNLGDAALRYVSAAARPPVQQPPSSSQHSVAASDDYYSLDSSSSSPNPSRAADQDAGLSSADPAQSHSHHPAFASSQEHLPDSRLPSRQTNDRATIVRYSTPPSRSSSEQRYYTEDDDLDDQGSELNAASHQAHAHPQALDVENPGYHISPLRTHPARTSSNLTTPRASTFWAQIPELSAAATATPQPRAAARRSSSASQQIPDSASMELPRISPINEPSLHDIISAAAAISDDDTSHSSPPRPPFAHEDVEPQTLPQPSPRLRSLLTPELAGSRNTTAQNRRSITHSQPESNRASIEKVLSETKDLSAQPQHVQPPAVPPPRAPGHLHTASSSWRNPHHAGGSPPTPGNDDRPYIQFAIDQLTRDEEVLGHSRDGLGSPDPVEPASPLEYPSTSGAQRPTAGAQPTSPAPPDQAIRAPDEAHVPARRSHSVSPVSELSQADGGIGPAEDDDARAAVLLPAHPPADAYRYPPLDFVPQPLRLLPLSTFILYCIALLVLIIYSSAHAAQHAGLLAYDGVGTTCYFVFEYLPQLLAVLAIVWLQYIQSALQRVLPFLMLARDNPFHTDEVLDGVPLYLTNFLWPNISPFRGGEPLLGCCSVVFWLVLFTIPLASCLYQTHYFADDPDTVQGVWKWTTVQPIAFVLIILYAALIVAVVAMIYRLRRHPTGLKWDPISLADIFVLLRRSTDDHTARGPGFAVQHSRNPSGQRRPASIGYWESTSRPGDIWHGIGRAFGPATHIYAGPSPQLRDGADLEAALRATSPQNSSVNAPLQASTFESWHSSHHGSRSQPIYLRDTYVILFPTIALILLAAFYAATYARSALILGFDPRLPAADGATASFSRFAPADFLYSFLPALIATLLPLLWIPIDTAFRYLQPFASLAKKSSRNQAMLAHEKAAHGPGSSATASLLLSYPAEPPLFVSLQALITSHYRVALISFLTLVAWTLPIFAGGMFSALFVVDPSSTQSTTSASTASAANHDASMPGMSSDGRVVIRADPPALYALTALLTVYALGWLAIYPRASRRLWTSEDRALDVRYLSGVARVMSEDVVGENGLGAPLAGLADAAVEPQVNTIRGGGNDVSSYHAADQGQFDRFHSGLPYGASGRMVSSGLAPSSTAYDHQRHSSSATAWLDHAQINHQRSSSGATGWLEREKAQHHHQRSLSQPFSQHQHQHQHQRSSSGVTGRSGATSSTRWHEPARRADLVTRLVGGRMGSGRWGWRGGKVVRVR